MIVPIRSLARRVALYNRSEKYRYKVNVSIFGAMWMMGCTIGLIAYLTDREHLTPYAVISACVFGSVSLLYKVKIMNRRN